MNRRGCCLENYNDKIDEVIFHKEINTFMKMEGNF